MTGKSNNKRKVTRRQKLFFAPADPKLAKIVTIKNPAAFKKSIRALKKKGLTTTEKRALVVAKNRAGAQLKRKNLSASERAEFTRIRNIKLPRVTKRRKK